MRSLSIKKILLLLLLILTVLGTVITGGMLYLAEESRHLEKSWHDYQLEHSEKARLTSQLNSILGYGGVIHSFKNMVLRRDLNKHDKAHSDMGAADLILVQYGTLAISERERAAIDDIRATIDKYRAALEIVAEAITQGKSAHEIDQMVRIDDTLALRGVKVLREENLMQRRGATEEVGKALYVSALRSHLGYGGMIHAYKNYILRKDEKHGEVARQSLQNALTVIGKFRDLGVNGSEALALDDIENTIHNYANGMKAVSEMMLVGETIEHIDESVRVDDVLALRGFKILDLEISHQIKQMADEMSAELNHIMRTDNLMAMLVVSSVVIVMLLCVWLLLVNIGRPIGEMTSVMRRLAEGDTASAVPLYQGDNEVGHISHATYAQPLYQGDNEVGHMSRAIAVFKENAVKREEAELELTQANEEMVGQLNELREMRAGSETQAEKALSLAESLATARDQALEATHQAESDKERVRAVVDTVSDGVITINPKGVIKSVNIAAELIFGYQESELLSKNVKMLMPDSYKKEHDQYISNYMETGDAQIISPRGSIARRREVTGIKKDGSTFPLELSIGVSNVLGEAMFTGVVRDISKQKEVETMKAEFVSTVSHELRTPLTSIKGSLGLLASGVTGAEFDPASTELLQVSMRNVDRLSELINDILDIEKLEAGALEFRFGAVSIDEILNEAISVNQHYAINNGVTFELANENAAGDVYADANRIAQVMSNLLSNAAKFSPKDGMVTLSAKPHLDGMIRFSVEDQGVGIPEEFRGRIFERFTQVDSSDRRKKGGTGLGMAITKSIIDSHCGHIDFTSVVDQGTTFFFDLPVEKPLDKG